MTRLIRRSALVICMLAIAAPTGAQVVLVSQSRSVSVDATVTIWGWWDSHSLSAPDFDRFEEDISAFSQGTWYSQAAGFAAQFSEIQTGRFSIHGSASAYAVESGWVEHGIGVGHGGSSFEVLFEVLEPIPFSLAGALAGSGASLQLDRDGVPYLSFDPDGNNEITVSEVGVLEPGSYNLTVNATASAYQSSSQDSSFDLDFFFDTPVATDEMAWGQVKALYR